MILNISILSFILHAFMAQKFLDSPYAAAVFKKVRKNIPIILVGSQKQKAPISFSMKQGL
jgi:hypothetical protein